MSALFLASALLIAGASPSTTPGAPGAPGATVVSGAPGVTGNSNGNAGFFLQRDLDTMIESDAEVFISLRYMRHIWVTADGAQAVAVQHGGLGGQGLALYKSLDDGVTWTLEADLDPRVDLISDGIMLADGSLRLVTSLTSTGPVEDVEFLALDYDAPTRSWNLAPSTPTTVFDSNLQLRASRGTLAEDSNGVLWTSFRLNDTSTGFFTIRLHYSTDGGLTWLDSQNEFGSQNVFVEKGAKTIATGSGIAVVYQDIVGPGSAPVRFKSWAWRDDAQPLDAAMPTEQLAQMQAQGGDPLGSHWSVAADDLGNIHLTYQDNRVKYLKYDAAAQSWSNPIPLGFWKGSYNKISVGDSGELYVFAQLTNFNKNKVLVKRFLPIAQEWSPWIPVSATVQPGFLRMCSPERFSGQLPMVYQINAGAPYGLLYCLLDTSPGGTSPAPEALEGIQK